MTDGPLEFTLARNANPASDEVRADDPGAIPGSADSTPTTWCRSTTPRARAGTTRGCIPYGPIELDPSAIVLHYAQEVFEGLKAYRWADGSIVSFRPDANAARLRTSARRLAIPELPDEVFIESLRQLIAVDGDWVPAAGGEESLYLRPFIFATEPGLGVRPANRVPLHGDRLAGGRVLQGRHQTRQRVAVAPSTCGPDPAAPARPSSAATTRRRCSRRPRPPTTAATRWCGWTPSNAATSRRWAA